MSRLDDVEAELEQLAALLQPLAEDSPDEMSADWFDQQSLLRRQLALLDERTLAMLENELELEFNDGPARRGRIEVRFLTDILDHFQKLLTTTAQAITGGQEDRGRFSQETVDATRLELSASSPGSFRLSLNGPPRVIQQDLFDEDEYPLFDEAIDILLNVIDEAGTDVSDKQLLEAAGPMDSRSLNHLEQLCQSLARHGTALTVRHRSRVDSDHARVARFSSLAAYKLYEILRDAAYEVEYLTMRGQLTGARWSRENSFDLEVPTERGIDHYSGTMILDLRPRIRELFDRDVVVRLERTVISTRLGETRSASYRLVHVEEPDPADGVVEETET